MSLYKFTSLNIGKQILENLSIRFTQPAAFNDPFDCFPLIDFEIKEEFIQSFVKIIFSHPQIFEKLKDQTLTNVAEPHSLLKFIPKDIVWQMAESYMLKKSSTKSLEEYVINTIDFNDIKPLVKDQFNNYLRSIFGVLSLSAKWKNPLMWAHYADSQYGLVIEFDEKHDFFAQQTNFKYTKLNHVMYMKDRPHYVFEIDSINSIESQGEVGEIFLQKSIDWEYEKEYRMVRILDSKYNSKIRDMKNFEIYLYPIPKAVIKSVIFGLTTTTTDINRIIDIAEVQCLNIPFYRITQNNRNYEINKKKIKKGDF